jgi:hypothetical protein
MARTPFRVVVGAWLTLSGVAVAEVLGTMSTFTSPRGIQEQCVAIASIPGGTYSDQDRVEERRLCGVDLWAPSVGLCPKTWSTSPGTVVFDISSGAYADDPARFEREACGHPERVRAAAREVARHKQTMNTSESSATFSTASLLYYHLSRYFDSTVNVPVAVYRTIDKDMHLKRVTEPGVRVTANRSSLRMLHAGWRALQDGETNPAGYVPTDELFTSDRSCIHGILIMTSGKRYGTEINGTRASGWGAGQNLDFQNTAPFLALRGDKALPDAIRAGLEEARKNPALNRDLGPRVADVQMVFWMKELTEIVLFDFIFSQQDRIGNIDYNLAWHWVEDGRARSRPADSSAVPGDLKNVSPVLLKRTWINDNDAGGRPSYVDFAEKTHMLEKIRHMGADTYRTLLALDRDFVSAGPVYRYFRDSFGLTQGQLSMIVRHTAHAAAIVRESCRAGHLRFDLDPERFLVEGGARAVELSCDAP